MDTTRLLRLIVSCLLALTALTASALAGSLPPQTEPGDPLDPRTYAPASTAFLTVHASGVQKYACQANGSWLFSDPVADLYEPSKLDKPVGTHYLNFATGRPVWRLKDGSTVEAARTVTVPAGPGNIAALLLKSAVASAGADGDRLAKATWVQRLNPSGGVAPAGTCVPGDPISVPYTTDYVFWTEKTAAA